MQSKLSKGLFHRSIAQSGTNLAPWGAVAHRGVAEERAQELGKMMGCTFDGQDYGKMVECLRNVSAENITKAFYDFFKWDTDPMVSDCIFDFQVARNNELIFFRFHSHQSLNMNMKELL